MASRAIDSQAGDACVGKESKKGSVGAEGAVFVYVTTNAIADVQKMQLPLERVKSETGATQIEQVLELEQVEQLAFEQGMQAPLEMVKFPVMQEEQKLLEEQVEQFVLEQKKQLPPEREKRGVLKQVKQKLLEWQIEQLVARQETQVLE